MFDPDGNGEIDIKEFLQGMGLQPDQVWVSPLTTCPKIVPFFKEG